MTDIDITSLDLGAYPKRDRKELLKQLAELDREPAINSNDPRIENIATRIREIVAKDSIAASDVLIALGKNLRIKVVVQKKGRMASPPGTTRRKNVARKTAGRKKAKPKFRHPDDPTKTWAGKGPQPKWMKEEIEAGRSKEDFLVHKTNNTGV